MYRKSLLLFAVDMRLSFGWHPYRGDSWSWGNGWDQSLNLTKIYRIQRRKSDGGDRGNLGDRGCGSVMESKLFLRHKVASNDVRKVKTTRTEKEQVLSLWKYYPDIWNLTNVNHWLRENIFSQS